jgi:predicted amidohydrolase
MKKNVLVALWSFRSDRHYGTQASAITPGLELMLKATASKLQQSQSTIETQNAFQAIFVAPEYLFVGQRSTQRRAAMRASSKDRLVSSLRSISKQYPKILIIAGTAFWREDLDTVEKQDRYNANTLGAYLKTTNFGRTKNLSAEDTCVLNGHTDSKTQKTIPGLGDLVGKIPKYRAYNTMYAFLGGELAFKYNKECDYFETDGASPAKITYIPGVSGGIREVANFQFGLEICLDHANDTLKGKQADFHIVVSDWTETKASQIVGTYLLHASTQPSQTGVYQSLPQAIDEMPTINNQYPNDYTLDYWLCPIDARP